MDGDVKWRQILITVCCSSGVLECFIQDPTRLLHHSSTSGATSKGLNVMADVTLTVDGDSVAVAPGTTILKAAEQLGRQIPTICYHDHCTANGLCRVCVVEVNGVKPLVPSCLTSVREGIQVSTT